MASAGREGYQFDRKGKVGFRKVQWQEVVFGNIADSQRI